MLWRPLILITVLLTALVSVAWVGLTVQAHRQARRVAAAEQDLHADDTFRRLEAAALIVAAHPERTDARLVKARAEIALGQEAQARQTLSGLPGIDSDTAVEAALLCADSYLSEAEGRLAADTSASAVDLLAERVNALLAEAETYRRLLAAVPAAEAGATTLHARLIDLRIVLARRQLGIQAIELARARGANFEEQIRSAGEEVTRLENQIAALDQQQEGLCRHAIALDPVGPYPRTLLFRLFLRRGDFAKARAVAAEIAVQPRLDRAVAGVVAGTLLNLEAACLRPTTDDDRRLAAKVLAHPRLVGPSTLEFLLAQAALPLRQPAVSRAQAAPAAALLQAVPAQFQGHPRVVCLLGEALARAGRIPEAQRLLQSFNERTSSPQGRFALALVHLAAGNTASAREALRQCLDAAPEMLLPRLELAELMVRSGLVLEAESDIQAAVGLSPRHPRVLALHTRLLLEKADVVALGAAVRQHAAECPLAPRDVLLAVALATDDLSAAQRWSTQGLPAQHQHRLAYFAANWCQAPHDGRHRVGPAVARALLELVDDDPLQHPEPPPIPALDRARAAALDIRPADALAPPTLEPLTTSRYVPLPEQTALELLELVRFRFPPDPDIAEAGAALALMLGRPGEVAAWLDAAPVSEPSPLRNALRAFCAGNETLLVVSLTQFPSGEGRTPPIARWLALAAALRAGDAEAATLALGRALKDHPYGEQPLLLAVRDAVARGRLDRADTFLKQAAALSDGEPLSRLTQARLLLARRQPAAVLAMPERRTGADASPELRRLATEIRARAYLATGQPDLAVAMFEGLAMAAREQRPVAEAAAADIWIEAGRPASAALGLQVLADGQLPPRWVDRLAARALVTMPAARAQALIDSALQLRPTDALLLLYKAELLARQQPDDLSPALALVSQVLQSRPDAPRALLLKADLLARQNHLPDALALARRVAAAGGLSADAARRRIRQWGG